MKFKAILAKKRNRAIAEAEFFSAMRDFIKVTDKDFESTVQTWNTMPPFVTEVVLEKKRVVGRNYTTDKIYKFISGGTKERYAVMTKNFLSKTLPSMLKARHGRGGLAYMLSKKKGDKPKPGIKAREFPKKIIKLREKEFKRIYDRAVKNIAAKI